MPNPRELDRRLPNELSLRDLVERRVVLFFECSNCYRLTPVDLLDLIARFGPDSRLEPIRFKARCTRCGKKRAKPLLQFPPLRKGTWWPAPPRAGR